jgi:hypothetical protein
MKLKSKWEEVLGMGIYLVTLSTIIAFLLQAIIEIF